MNLNDDAAGRLEALEVKLGLKDSPPPEDQWDQQHASYLLGCEAELTEAKSRKDKSQIDAVTAAMTEFLDSLGPQRRKAVQAIMATDRPLRGQAMPRTVFHQGAFGMDHGSTETRHYADGRTETISAATNEPASPPATFGRRS